MRAKRQWFQGVLLTILTVLTAGLVYSSREFAPFASAVTRYMLFLPVVFSAHFYGISGGIAASLGLSTLLVPLVVGRALASGQETYGMDTTMAIIALNLTGYFWGALAGAQRRQRQIYQQLYMLAQQVTLDPAVTAHSMLEAALANVPAGGGLVTLTIDPDFKLRVLAAQGLSAPEIRSLEDSFLHGETVIEWAIVTRRGQILNRLDQDQRFISTAGAPRNLLAVPLTRGEEICGGIVLFDRAGGQDFGRPDLEWLTRLAERASVALENARLYAVSQAVAEENAKFYKELKVYASELDRLVEERTCALTKALADLRSAEEDLVQTSRLAALGELAGRVAHEILNPLTGILGRVQGRLAELTDDPAHRPLGLLNAILNTWRARESAGGLAAYLVAASETEREMTCGQEDLRDLGRLVDLTGQELAQRHADLAFIEAQTLRLVRLVESLRELGRRTRSTHLLELAPVVGEAAEVMAAYLRRIHVNLVMEGLTNLPPVEADPDELVQVFTNLLRNAAQAVEAAGRGHGKIIVQGRVMNNRVELRIGDDGTGISPECLDKVFEAGFTTKPREQGTGLGLSITRRFVRECHGDVELEATEVDQGTTFLIWFPRTAEADVAATDGQVKEEGHGYHQSHDSSG